MEELTNPEVTLNLSSDLNTTASTLTTDNENNIFVDLSTPLTLALTPKVTQGVGLALGRLLSGIFILIVNIVTIIIFAKVSLIFLHLHEIVERLYFHFSLSVCLSVCL